MIANGGRMALYQIQIIDYLNTCASTPEGCWFPLPPRNPAFDAYGRPGVPMEAHWSQGLGTVLDLRRKGYENAETRALSVKAMAMWHHAFEQRPITREDDLSRLLLTACDIAFGYYAKIRVCLVEVGVTDYKLQKFDAISVVKSGTGHVIGEMVVAFKAPTVEMQANCYGELEDTVLAVGLRCERRSDGEQGDRMVIWRAE